MGVDKEFVLGLYPMNDYIKNGDEDQSQVAGSFDLYTQNLDEESKLFEGSFKEPLSKIPVKSVSAQ